jgi:ferredoxin
VNERIRAVLFPMRRAEGGPSLAPTHGVAERRNTMTAKELKLEDEGIQVTGFEAPRRIAPEVARQQCALCGSDCIADCPMDCDTVCDSDCWNQCVYDESLVAKYVASPKALLRSNAYSRANTSYHAITM